MKRVFYFWASVAGQICFVTSAVLIIVFLFYKKTSDVVIADPMPYFEQFMPKDLAKMQSTTQVKVGMFIKNFPTFDMRYNNFVMDAILWFEFNPHRISLDTISNFAFENASILKKSTPTTRIFGNNTFASYDLRLQFTSNLTFSAFPFEDHRLFIILSNPHVIPREMMYSIRPIDFQKVEYLYTGDWMAVDFKAKTGYSSIVLDKSMQEKTITYPLTVFSVDFVKAGFRKIVVIFIPLFLSFFLGLFSLLVNIYDRRSYLSLSLGSLSAMFAYRFVIESITPNVGYFTIADKLYTFYLALLFIIFVWNIYLASKFSGVADKIKEDVVVILASIRLVIFYVITILLLAVTYFGLFV